MMRRILSLTAKVALGAIVLLAPVRIAATPERVVGVGDQAIAIGPHHAYVLRVTSDNLGFHGFSVRDTFLLELDLSDGAVTQVWPVQRVSLDTITGGPVVRHLAMPDAVDAFAVLRDRGAITIQIPSASFSPRVSLEADAVEITDLGGTAYSGETRNLLDNMSRGLEMTGRAIGAYEDLGDISVVDPTRPVDILSGQFYNADDCRVNQVYPQFPPGGDAPSALVTLVCEGDLSAISVVLPIPVSGGV